MLNSSKMKEDGSWRLRTLYVCLGITALIVLLYPTYLELFDFWWNYSAYNHCILIVPIAAYLAYEKRNGLLSESPGVSWRGFIYTLLNCLLWLAGSFFSIAFFQHAAAIGLIVGLVWSLIGNSRAWVIAFPLFYLYFGVPEGEVLVPYLRDLTAEVVVRLLRITGIPVFLEGHYLTIPSGHFHVAKACSGINYLIATLAVGTVFAYTRYQSIARRCLFMLLVILVPLIANGLRAYGIVMIAHLSDYKLAMGIDHYIYGWLFFGIVIFILFAIGNTFSDVDTAREPMDIRKSPTDSTSPGNLPLIIWVLSLMAVAFTLALNERVTSSPMLHDQFELQAGDSWRKSTEPPLDLMGSYEGAPLALNGSFEKSSGDQAVSLQMAIYLNRSTHGELENRANIIYDEEKWRRVSGPTNIVPDLESLPRVDEFILRRSTSQYIVWTWYDLDGLTLTDRKLVKWELTKARVSGYYRGGAQLSVVTIVDRGIDSARGRLEEFIIDVKPSMGTFRIED